MRPAQEGPTPASNSLTILSRPVDGRDDEALAALMQGFVNSLEAAVRAGWFLCETGALWAVGRTIFLLWLWSTSKTLEGLACPGTNNATRALNGVRKTDNNGRCDG